MVRSLLFLPLLSVLPLIVDLSADLLLSKGKGMNYVLWIAMAEDLAKMVKKRSQRGRDVGWEISEKLRTIRKYSLSPQSAFLTFN